MDKNFSNIEVTQAKLQNKRLLTHMELAVYLSVGRNKAFNLLHTQGFPTVKIGRRIFANREQVDKWIDENTGR